MSSRYTIDNRLQKTQTSSPTTLGKGMTKEPGRDKVDRACKRGDSQFILGMANRNLPITQTKENRSDDVTNLYNQEMKEYIVTEHNAEL